jgi:hypothetical protein
MEREWSMDARKPAAAPIAAVFAALVIVSSGASFRTQNFVVEAPTPELAEEIGRMAEHYRHDLAIEWLGAALPNWAQPCPIHAQVAPQLGAGGATSFTFDHSEVFGWHMEIQGSHERLLDSVLPHEVTHTIFASHFRRPLPRWADEGACTTVEDISERSKQDRMLIQFLHTGRGIAFSQMFAMTDYPQDILPLYAQGYSLARFLMDQKGKREFLAYIGDGMSSENWIAATNKYYGFKNLAVLQDSWLDWVKQGSPARSPGVSRASGNLALAKAGPEHNVIVRAQSADRAPGVASSGNNNSGETQWAPVARQASTAIVPASAPIRNGSVAMETGAAIPLPTNMTAAVPTPGKSVYGEGVGLIHHSADFQGEGTIAAPSPAAAVPAANSSAGSATIAVATPADSPPSHERKVLLEWSRQP